MCANITAIRVKILGAKTLGHIGPHISTLSQCSITSFSYRLSARYLRTALASLLSGRTYPLSPQPFS